ncbi:beta-1,6-galactofuranosyltransferase [Companilactobacillus sp. RD055328]|uniref:sugar transferase n=1 Tax=Companilactobacillus sp. RD055328 TaxID=2916634 RepID=UPI001FC7DFB2|nr:sugar transferase [Companilactobacillus sp. RD055328]GKQ42757.1 beta-1,6-galactofuranosyltransferase [Companilactobacillus sp. RD055328]
MKKFITNLYGHSFFSTARNAQFMFTKIAKDQGYIELPVPTNGTLNDSDSELKARIDTILGRVSKDDLIILQTPTWNNFEFEEALINRIKELNIKLIVFIQDLIPLMFENNYYLMPRFIEAYDKADLVIVPSEKMGNKLLSEGLTTPYIVQGIWDHYTRTNDFKLPTFKREINFIGNFIRFPFSINWDKDIDLNVYCRPNGPDDTTVRSTEHMNVKGYMEDELLLHELNNGGFGLVWSEDIDNQAEREYSTMNASYKFSTYLAAGIPIIVNKGLAKQKFVEKYGIGYVADSLDDVAEYVKNITNDEYNVMAQNTKNVSALVRSGFFAKKLLLEVEEQILLEH